ncbi:TspO/MBR family protein [Caenispirillum salinarum]|uniref:TspO/MBR family protein n=1 Tax=Caenispirillum salinarum TaxID=859058 RepID=UPI0038511DD0
MTRPLRPLPDRLPHRPSRRHQDLSGLVFLGGFIAATAAISQYYAPTREQPEIAEHYERLDKPSLTPSRRTQGVIWPALWGLMGLSCWRVWRSRESPDRDKALGLFRFALGMTAGFAKMAFGNRKTTAAAADMLGVAAASAAYTYKAGTVDRLAGLLALPYTAWLGFVSVLAGITVLRERD